MPATIETLNARLTALEDRSAIADLIAGYGPAVDALDGPAAADIWTPDGAYRIGADITLSDRAEIAALTQMAQHRAYVAQGCGHVLSPHKITVTGTSAVAHGYSMVMVHDADTGSWTAARLSANRWRFEKANGGWRATERQATLLDGDAAARALLAWSTPQENTE